MNSFFWIVCSLALGQRKRSWAVHAHWKTFLPLLAWDTDTPNAVKLVLQKVTEELLLHGRHMSISLRLICVHFKLKSVGARDSSDFRHYKSNVFVFPPRAAFGCLPRTGPSLSWAGRSEGGWSTEQVSLPRDPGKGMDWYYKGCSKASVAAFD